MSTTTETRRTKATPPRCPCAGKTLDKLVQPAILSLLARNNLHGYKILQELAAMAICNGCSPDATGVYRALRLMEKRGHVRSQWGLSDAGPARRQYGITQTGRDCLQRWVLTLDEYRNAIDQLLASARGGIVQHTGRRRCIREKGE